MEGDISVRPSRSNPIRIGIKGSHSQGETIRACAKAGWGQCFFFLLARRLILLQETGFLHVKGIKTFGYKTCNTEGIRTNFKILKKNNIEAHVIFFSVVLSVICHFLSVRFGTSLETETLWLVRNS